MKEEVFEAILCFKLDVVFNGKPPASTEIQFFSSIAISVSIPGSEYPIQDRRNPFVTPGIHSLCLV